MGKFRDVKTLYAYIARTSEEMSFESGVTLKILEKPDEFWWMATTTSIDGAESGLVPSNYVQEIGGEISNGACEEEIAYMVPDDLFGLNYHANSAIKTTSSVSTDTSKSAFSVLSRFEYTAQRSDELSFNKNVLLKILDTECEFQGWWKARDSKGTIGLIPSNYVEAITAHNTYKNKNNISSGSNRNVFNGESVSTDETLQNDSTKLNKQQMADLLVERQSPFPQRKAEEAKASPGVKALTKKLVTGGSLGE